MNPIFTLKDSAQLALMWDSVLIILLTLCYIFTSEVLMAIYRYTVCRRINSESLQHFLLIDHGSRRHETSSISQIFFSNIDDKLLYEWWCERTREIDWTQRHIAQITAFNKPCFSRATFWLFNNEVTKGRIVWPEVIKWRVHLNRTGEQILANCVIVHSWI